MHKIHAPIKKLGITKNIAGTLGHPMEWNISGFLIYISKRKNFFSEKQIANEVSGGWNWGLK